MFRTLHSVQSETVHYYANVHSTNFAAFSLFAQDFSQRS